MKPENWCALLGLHLSPLLLAILSQVGLSIFFHDSIYDATAKDNEEQSAQQFRRFATSTSLPADTIGAFCPPPLFWALVVDLGLQF